MVHTSHIPRPSHRPVFAYCEQSKTGWGKVWECGYRIL